MGFLAQEKIIPEVEIENFMSGENKFNDIFGQVSAIKTKTSKKSIRSDDTSEANDLADDGWETLKRLKSDEERVKHAQHQFQNKVRSYPGRNLTIHRFRRKSDASDKLATVPIEDFVINFGKCKPISSDVTDSDNMLSLSTDTTCRKIKYSDFVTCMKAVLFKKYEEKVGNKVVSSETFDSFKVYLGHYKAGQDETANFLSFYNSRMELEELQTKEVIDLESQFSKFPCFYGDLEPLMCPSCD